MGVAVEIVVPAVLLPGGTMTLPAGALIGAGGPALAVAVPVAVAGRGVRDALPSLRRPGGQATVTWTVCHPVAPLGSGPWYVEVCV